MSKKFAIPCYSAYLTDGYPSSKPIPSTGDWKSISVSQAFHIADIDIADRLGRTLGPLPADLLELGIGVFLHDCFSPRCSWQRDMRLIIPVRNPEIWNQAEIRRTLTSALECVTGDSQWEIRFVRHSGPFREAETKHYLELDVPHRVCLFSEGLDSFCGLAERLRTFPTEHFLAISAVIQSQCKPFLDASGRFLAREYKHRLIHLPVRMHRRLNVNRLDKQDHYQRTRSFLLLLLGAAVALMIEQDKVEIYENGIECCNFPSSLEVLPAQESRAMHPLFLDRMSRFMTVLTGRPFRFVAPNLLRTKSAMLRTLDEPLRSDLWERTLSCMHFPQRRPKERRYGKHRSKEYQCGCCQGCILRRLAFQISGLPDSPEDYRFVVNSEDSIRYRRVSAYDEMRGQVNELNMALRQLNMALRQSDQWEALLARSGVEAELWDTEFEESIGRVGEIPLQEVRP